MISAIYSLNIRERRKFIKSSLKKMGISFKTGPFIREGYEGENIIVTEWAKEGFPNIIISAHYDGWGAYDNAGGTAGLLWLLKWAGWDKLITLNGSSGLIVVFLDGEESGLLGAKDYIENSLFDKNLKVKGQISLDGFGIGTHIGGFANTKKIRLRIDREKEIELVLEADTSIFQQYQIPSLHLFSLPYEELKDLLDEKKFPPSWQILHTTEDSPDKIDEGCLPFVILHLYQNIPLLDFQSEGVITIGEKK